MPVIDRRSAVVLATGGAVVLVACVVLLDRFYRDPEFVKPHDFLQYWAAGRLNATGYNPYDARELNAIQKAAGRPDENPVLMWNPPWALTLTMPIGLLGPRTAQLVWVAGQFALILVCAVWLWRLYCGDPSKWWVACALAVVAPMTAANLVAGQCGGWLLLGLTGFLTAVMRKRPAFAALAALCALKPHLFVPFWILLVLDATRQRAGLSRLLWGLIAGAVAILIPLVVNSRVWSQYLLALANPGTEGHVPLSAWQPPLVGYWLRVWTDPAAFWIQFVPTVLVAVLTPLYWWRRRATWDWHEELPRVILAGAVAAPYGAWDYDLVILLVPVVAAAARLSRAGRPGVVWAAGGGAVLFIVAASQVTISLYGVWMTPAVLLGYCYVMRRTRNPSPGPSPLRGGEKTPAPPSLVGEGGGGLGAPTPVEAAPCP
jgi:hypothetical protein